MAILFELKLVILFSSSLCERLARVTMMLPPLQFMRPFPFLIENFFIVFFLISFPPGPFSSFH